MYNLDSSSREKGVKQVSVCTKLLVVVRSMAEAGSVFTRLMAVVRA